MNRPFVLPINAGFFGLADQSWDPLDGLNDDAVKLFTRGHCHALALALAERTGWPLYVMVPEDEYVPGIDPAATIMPRKRGTARGTGAWQHLVVKRPGDGALIDVQGPGVDKRWSDYVFIGPVSPDAVRASAASRSMFAVMQPLRVRGKRANLNAARVAVEFLLPALDADTPVK